MADLPSIQTRQSRSNTANCSALLAPNARFQPLPKAGARNERTLEAVGCKPLLGPAPAPRPREMVPDTFSS
jgi:hypothetical protein